MLLLVTCGPCRCGSDRRRIPLADFQTSDLVGIWEAHYTYVTGIEMLVFKEDGTYQQIYEGLNDYLYVSSWNEWQVERRVDGRIWVYLEGGRWFPEGPEIADLEGMDPFRPETVHHFYDHATNSSVAMQGRLILDVIPRSNSKGFVLMHFAYDVDSGTDLFRPAEP